MLLTLPAANSWQNATTLSSIAGSLIITNLSSGDMFLYVGATAPTGTLGILARQDEEVYVDNRTAGNYVWIRGDIVGPILIQSIIKPSAQFTMIGFPSGMLTDNNEGIARLRVDNSETSFFTGKQFRTFKEISIANGASYVIKVVTTSDMNTLAEDIAIDSGSLRLTIYSGATPTGTFTDTLPILRKNMMASAPVFTSGTTITGGTGITLAGGTTLDIVRVVAANATAQQSTSTQDVTSRGVPAGTYYYKLENIGSGTVTGTIHSFWEER